MNQYMVEIFLPAYLSQAFVDLIPQQRTFVNKMFEKGIITGYSLSSDSSKAWVAIKGESQAGVEAVIKQFPVYHHIKYTVKELMFNETTGVVAPSISLN